MISLDTSSNALISDASGVWLFDDDESRDFWDFIRLEQFFRKRSFSRYLLYFAWFSFKFCLHLCFLIRSFSFFASVINSRYFLHISALVSPLYFPHLDLKFEWKCVRIQQTSLQNFMSKMERQCVQMNLQQIYSI